MTFTVTEKGYCRKADGSLDLTLADIWSAQKLAGDLASRWPYKAESWQQTNAQLVSALNAQSVSTAVIRGVVMVVVVRVAVQAHEQLGPPE